MCETGHVFICYSPKEKHMFGFCETDKRQMTFVIRCQRKPHLAVAECVLGSLFSPTVFLNSFSISFLQQLSPTAFFQQFSPNSFKSLPRALRVTITVTVGVECECSGVRRGRLKGSYIGGGGIQSNN